MLTVLLSMAPASHAGMLPPSTSDAPVLLACNFIPDPRTNASFDCFDPGASAAFSNVSVFFQANVTDVTGDNLTVTFAFDYLIPNGTQPPIVNPDSPIRSVNVTSPGDGLPVSANVTWVYSRPNANFTAGQYYVHIEVRNETGAFDPDWGTTSPPFFPVYVTTNSEPFMDNLLSLNAAADPILPWNPVVPLIYENVTVGDPDSDAVTITWDWGDGTRTVNTTERLVDPLALRVTHQYAASSLPLNESPRNVDIPVRVWVDDRLGHNVSYSSITEFYIAFDNAPSVRIERPAVGSIWKVGEPVSMVGNVTDPEGDPTTAFWDFDNKTDSTGTGNPAQNHDADGLTATHTYTLPGLYNVTFWASDGNKLYCVDVNCTDFRTHWRNATLPIEVRYNLPPVVGLSNATAVAGRPTLLRASVYDPDGDNMTVRWVFGDGTPDAFNATGSSPRNAPKSYSVVQDHNYTIGGYYTFSISVSDGNETVNATEIAFVQSFNLPPVILNIIVIQANGTEQGTNKFTFNSTVAIKVLVYDPENDTLNLSVDWDDGTIDHKSFVLAGAANCTTDNRSRNVCPVWFSHFYGDIGTADTRNYSIRVTVTDDQLYLQLNLTGGPPIRLNHTKEMTTTVYITHYRYRGLGPWDWWDYSMLAVVIAVPTILVGRFAWKVRREREEA